jgi:integrase
MMDPQHETSAAPSRQVARGAPHAARALAPQTARLYASGWAAFVAWCRAARVAPLPAEPRTVAAYLATLGHLSPGAAARRLAAISDQHRRAGLPVSTTAPGVRSALRQARRTAPPRRKPLPAPALLLRMAASCPRDLAGLRDRALLLLLAEAGLNRSALTGLQAEHVRFTASGVELRTEDADGASRLAMAAPRKPDHATCPARALEDWLRTSDTAFGPVFRKLDRWGNLEHHRLGPDAVRRILIQRALRRPRHAAPGEAA